MWSPLSSNQSLADLDVLESSPLLVGLSARERYALLEYFEVAVLAPGASFPERGAELDGAYVVLDGTIGIGGEGGASATHEKGSWLGLGALAGAAERRAGAVVAPNGGRMGRILRERFDRFAQSAPAAALTVLRGAFREARGERARATERNTQTLRSILPVRLGDALVVGARIDGRTVGLDTPVAPGATPAPLTVEDWEGREIYKRSAGLVVLEAARSAGVMGLRLGPSWSSGRLLSGGGGFDASLQLAVNEAIAASITRALPIREETWSTDVAAAHFRAGGWDDVADLVASSTASQIVLVRCGEVCVPSPGPMLPDASMLEGVAVHPHPDGLALDFGPMVRRQLAPRAAKTLALEALAPRYGADMTKDERRWLELLGVDSVGSFNRAVVTGEVSEVIRVAEGFHEKRLGRLADQIRDRSGVRIVAVAGPSSSGKTTFLKRLRVQLEVDGIQPVGISLDDYYVDRERTVRDAKGERDYEALEALDLPLLEEHVGRLLAGEAVQTARYDFIGGRSQPNGGPTLSLRSGNVLILEGLHALNPSLLPRVAGDRIHRVFIHPATALPFDPLTTLEPADVRLLRRIVRDRHGRGASAEMNLARWASVRHGERLHVFPHQAAADCVFDTSLLYEIGVLKVFAERYLLEVPRASPHYPAALRLRKLIAPFVTIYPDHVPPTSILREFIGAPEIAW